MAVTLTYQQMEQIKTKLQSLIEAHNEGMIMDHELRDGAILAVAHIPTTPIGAIDNNTGLRRTK